jgi:hypothetical protein
MRRRIVTLLVFLFVGFAVWWACSCILKSALEISIRALMRIRRGNARESCTS